MKKLLSLAVLLVVFCSSALIFAGCNSSNGTITFEGQMPYTITINRTDLEDPMLYDGHVATALSGINFTFKASEEDPGVTMSIAEARSDGASITGFSLKSAGTRTAKLAYKGVTEKFTYTVTINE